jgi:hypothetical protein
LEGKELEFYSKKIEARKKWDLYIKSIFNIFLF